MKLGKFSVSLSVKDIKKSKAFYECPPDGVCQTSSPPIGSIDALKVSDGTVLWHAKVDVHQAQFQPVQVKAVVGFCCDLST